MRIIEATELTGTVARLCIEANRYLTEDVRQALRDSRTRETWPVARNVLDKIITNFELAEKTQVPVCQDTGMACVFLEIGRDLHIEGDLQEAVDEGVRRGYRDGCLRSSVVRDPLTRVNTGDNTPAIMYLELVSGDRLTVTVAPKGFGSENMSRIKMLRHSDGIQGVIDFVTETAEDAGPNACPPIVLGIGIGGTFDKAALLAKKALFRPLGTPNSDPFYEKLERTILEKVNALGIGPQGFGGGTTALAAAVEVMPTHIAGLPCAVNINCHVTRHATEVL